MRRGKVLKNRYLFIVTIVIFTLITLAGGCGSSGKSDTVSDKNLNDENSIYPIILEDQMSRKVTIPKKPERIISLAPSNTEILFCLGLGDKVVGVTNFCDYPEEVKAIQKIGDYSEPNMEQIIALEPDLVLATAFQEEQVKQMEKLNIPTLVIEPATIDEMLDESIYLVGKAAGAEEKASEVRESLKERVSDVLSKTNNISESERPIVFYELYPSPIMTAGPGTFIDEIIWMAGGLNLAHDAESSYPEYSQEMIIAKNPDIILYSHHGTAKDNPEQIINRPGWQNVKAIKNGKVFYIDGNIIQRTTPRLIDALEQIAKIIHPELFE